MCGDLLLKFLKLYQKFRVLTERLDNFISNIESVVLNTSSTEKPYRSSKVATLSAYINMEHTCWNNINKQDIKQCFYGKTIKNSIEKEYAFSQIISLFTCEGSRNPTTFLTAPMVFELAEHFYQNEERENKKDLLIKLSCEIRQDNYLTEKEREEKEMLFDKYIEQIGILKDRALTIKYCFINYFPMAIKDAVPASRHTSLIINEAINNVNDTQYKLDNYYHQYDTGRPNVPKFELLTQKTSELFAIWSKEVLGQEELSEQSLIDLTRDWYNIELSGLITID